ncbi:hypothetical protein GCM10029992_55400 [Glycomyces albus]
MAEQPPSRARTITAVMWTQHLTAASVLLAAIGFLVVKETVHGEAEKLIQDHPDAPVVSGEIDWAVMASFDAMAVFYVVVAALYATLALLNRKGGETGRILSWYLSGFVLACCLPASLIGRLTEFGAGRSVIPQDYGGLDYRDLANDLVLRATPDWVTALDWLSVLMLTGGSLLILILLAFRAATERGRTRASTAPSEPSR